MIPDVDRVKPALTTRINAAGGGGIYIFLRGKVDLLNTIVANSFSGGDCGGLLPTSLDHNLDTDGTCNLVAANDLPNTNPLLDLLQDNGGPTETHALLPGSPAINHVPVANCEDGDMNPILIDQRGITRPQGTDCDIGSYEAVIVDIDIVPKKDSNTVICNREDTVVEVAILTTPEFDATTVDHTTVTFDEASETHIDKKTGLPRRHEKDVDRDGDTDLVFHFLFADTGLNCLSTEGTLLGETFGGVSIQGCDSINLVEHKGKKP